MSIIDCPSCAAQFRVPSAALPPEGRNLRCSACGHVWHYVDPLMAILQQDEDVAPEEQAPPPPEDQESGTFADVLKNTELPDMPLSPMPQSSAPSVAVQKPARSRRDCLAGYVAAGLIALLSLQILVWGQEIVTLIVPRMAVVYNLLGQTVPPPIPPLVFSDVTLERAAGKVTIKGNVVNQSERQRNIPSIRAVLVAGDGTTILGTWVFRADKTFVDEQSKKGSAPFSITRAADRVDDVADIRLTFVEKE